MTNYWDNSVPVISRITLALFEDTGYILQLLLIIMIILLLL